jgi:hypothetical protein
VADEPSNAELAWRLQNIQQMLAGLIGRPEYDADQRAADRRFTELAADIEDVRRQHAEDVRVLHERITEQARNGVEHRMHWRSVILTGVLPALVTGTGILVTWLISRGGH